MIITSIRKIAIVGGLFLTLSFGLSFHQALAGEHLSESAFKYQQKMSNLGYARAQYTLATMYEDGIGTRRNLDKALEWYKKAALQGHKPAQRRVDAMAGKKRQPSQRDEKSSRQQVEKKRGQERQEVEAKRQEAERILQEAEAQKRFQERVARDNERKQLVLERKRLEQERLQLEAEKARLKQARAEQERLAIEKARRELARKRAQEAMEKMMAIPDAMEEDE